MSVAGMSQAIGTRNLSDEECRDAVDRGDFDTLTVANMGLATYIASAFYRNCQTSLDYDEVESAAFESLTKAVQCWDPETGVRLGTWAAMKIRFALSDLLSASSHDDRRFAHWEQGLDEGADEAFEETVSGVIRIGDFMRLLEASLADGSVKPEHADSLLSYFHVGDYRKAACKLGIGYQLCQYRAGMAAKALMARASAEC